MIRSPRIQQLLALRGLAAERPAVAGDPVTFGINAIDRHIAGGLMQAALHEFFAASVEDASATAAFAAMVAMRGCPAGRPIFWVRERSCARHTGFIHAVGLAELGLDPTDLLLVEASDTLALLRAGADIVKCGQVGVVVVEPFGQAPLLDLTASRRLSMAAAISGVLTLVIRVDARPVPSAAHTRWQVASAPSSPLAANAPGHPAFTIALLRHRGGIAGLEARLEWNRDNRSFFVPLSGGLPAVSALGADQARPIDRSRAA